MTLALPNHCQKLEEEERQTADIWYTPPKFKTANRTRFFYVNHTKD